MIQPPSPEAYSNLPPKRTLELVGTKEAGKSSSAGENRVELVEEDWSEIMISHLSGGFAQHKKEEFQLSNGSIVHIASAPSLTPMDMVDLSWGRNDATGHCIWTGARFFLDILIPALGQLFIDRSILELGSGTGLVGIAIAKLFQLKELILTDASESALELCRYNCALNEGSIIIGVEELTWGESLLTCNDEQSSTLRTFDTVLATDVLYDIAAWEPLLVTASKSLNANNGVFLVSHVPRAALPDGCVAESLESHLIQVASQHHFRLVHTYQPSNFSTILDDWESLQERGVAIFEFQKMTVIND
ncbi:unnamed protein product [Cylindrotheca closterium]|uniref:Calmodulin-lysine N-methyltransferase n=1 Tax=Cylindrotheca closterium TaxID=2856 RepID=A0AAD2CR75_9STRA|nr:unnamed protein product [Cylindrotheca closterium]